MTTPTNSHKAWTDKGGHVSSIRQNSKSMLQINAVGRLKPPGP